MTKWIGVVMIAITLLVGVIGGALLFPRKIVVVRELPAVVQTHTVSVTDSGPYAVLRDSVAKLLVKLHVPVPPKPTPQQPQLIYGLSYIGKTLTLSVVQGGTPRYKEEAWSDVDPSFYVAWRDTGAYWDVTSWTMPEEATVVTTPKPKPWSPWRFSVSGGVRWFPGNDVTVFMEPGLLVLGHLKLAPCGEISLQSLRQSQIGAVRLGVSLSVQW